MVDGTVFIHGIHRRKGLETVVVVTGTGRTTTTSSSSSNSSSRRLLHHTTGATQRGARHEWSRGGSTGPLFDRRIVVVVAMRRACFDDGIIGNAGGQFVLVILACQIRGDHLIDGQLGGFFFVLVDVDGGPCSFLGRRVVQIVRQTGGLIVVASTFGVVGRRDAVRSHSGR